MTTDNEAASAPGEEETILQRRVKQRLEEMRLTARKASLQAGLGPDAIRLILSGRSKSPRGDTLLNLAQVLQCEVGYLLGEQETPFSSATPLELPDGRIAGAMPLYIQNRVQLGWRLARQEPQEVYASDILSLPQFLHLRQKLLTVTDDSFDQYFRAGTLIHVVSLRDHGDPSLRDGDIVVLVRYRGEPDDNHEIEISLRIARKLQPQVTMLETAPTNPRLRDTVMWEGPNIHPPKDDEYGMRYDPAHDQFLSIFGIVLRAYTHVTGPPIRGQRFEEATEAIDHLRKSVFGA